MHRLSKQYLAINQMMDCVVLREFHRYHGLDLVFDPSKCPSWSLIQSAMLPKFIFMNISKAILIESVVSATCLQTLPLISGESYSFLLTAQDWQVLVALASHAGAAAAATILVELAEKLNTAAQIL
ncbi:hypothetical protein V6N11_053766 [Hibiscus sabdariffa]|uniref:Uncharacterized protein n=1 Tax=Hibiscus sabdariffa TaxID=183260 RepID=A0ABR2S1X6_9ROSI